MAFDWSGLIDDGRHERYRFQSWRKQCNPRPCQFPSLSNAKQVPDGGGMLAGTPAERRFQ